MQDLRVIGAEDGALLVSDDDGIRYRLAVDDALQLKLRQVTPDPSIGQRLAPREIQAYIRSGMSAEDVASITGAPLDHIQRFEGPVLAEREFVVKSALEVPVHLALDPDPLAQGATFGSAIRARLHDLGATGERWASWKDASAGWIVKLSFAASQIDHDARWHFDPKKSALDPINNEAVTLSQQGEATGSLIPRLRAVQHEEAQTESTRFDSAAFDLTEADAPDARERVAELPHVADKAVTDEVTGMNQTADLLDALRRRRGEREAASYDDDEPPSPFGPASGRNQTTNIRLVDVPLEVPDETPEVPAARKTGPQPSARNTGSQPRARKGRAAMPSWDEIVFGARPDDDLA
ncbi:MAG TPA: septation protein SepH [Galbitalea sp.]|jgi:hypothetical protein|nr:septation protein SepH [Galbitalea sp.]